MKDKTKDTTMSINGKVLSSVEIELITERVEDAYTSLRDLPEDQQLLPLIKREYRIALSLYQKLIDGRL